MYSRREKVTKLSCCVLYLGENCHKKLKCFLHSIFIRSKWLKSHGKLALPFLILYDVFDFISFILVFFNASSFLVSFLLFMFNVANLANTMYLIKTANEYRVVGFFFIYMYLSFAVDWFNRQWYVLSYSQYDSHALWNKKIKRTNTLM